MSGTTSAPAQPVATAPASGTSAPPPSGTPGTGPSYAGVVYAFTRSDGGALTLYPNGGPAPPDATVITAAQWQLLGLHPNLVYDPARKLLFAPHPVLDAAGFRGLFTPAERGLAYAAALKNPVVLGGFLEAYALGAVDLTSPELGAWLNELVTEGVLDPARLPAIYAGVAPTS